MKCKYWDCGFCYAPNDVVTSASPSSSCIYPEHCLYLKTEMSKKIDTINLKDYIGKKVIVFHRNHKKVVGHITYDNQYHDYPYGFNYRRYTKDGKILIDNENGWDILKISEENTTYITTASGQPIDDVVVINGVEYRKTVKPDIKPKVKTLYDICVEWNDDDYNPPVSALIFKIEKEWTPLNLNQKENRGFTDGYSMGFDDALNMVRKTLK